jgi:5-methylcytosine-specific restriction protein A
MSKNVTEKIRNKIREKFLEAEKHHLAFIDIRSGNLYDELKNELNLPPGPNHLMPACCNAMCSLRSDQDKILEHPPKYQGTNLVIRYKIPR